jgi:hypothetical protein
MRVTRVAQNEVLDALLVARFGVDARPKNEGNKLMKLFAGKRKLVAVGGGIAALVAVGSGSAFAYFAGGGHGTGSATVGTAAGFSVAADTADSTAAIFPGDTGDVVAFTLTNSDTAHAQGIASIVATIPTAKDASGNVDIADKKGNPVTGCLAQWFQVGTDATGTVPLTDVTGQSPNGEVGAGGSVTVRVPITLTDTSTDQSACEKAVPQVKISIDGG